MTIANEKYTTKRYINVHIAFIIEKSLECGNLFENVGISQRNETKPPVY